MLRFNQFQDQLDNLEKSFFYEYEDLYEELDQGDKRRREKNKNLSTPSTFYI